MWKLTIEDDEGQRTTLELTHDEYSIGRAEDAVIRLTERNVSRRHAVIRATESGWSIEDEGSYNGTYVNGERLVQARALASGDFVQLGDYRMEIADHQVAGDDAAPLQRPDRLVMVVGPLPGTEYPLLRDRVMLGRAEEADISINHASVSRLHCELQSLGHGRWEAVDQGSANAIRINGVELRRGIIEPGDALELGDVRLRYVAAGKYFRPMATDLNHSLPAVPGMPAMPVFEGMPPFEEMPASGVSPSPATASKSRIGALIAAVAVVGALGLGAIVALRATSEETASASADAGEAAAASADEQARVLLVEAGKAAEDGDIETAHRMLQRIPESSPLRATDDFKALEDRWADAMFAKAEASADVDDKRTTLNRIAETSSVSAEKRKKAAGMALALGPASDLDEDAEPNEVAVAAPAQSTSDPLPADHDAPLAQSGTTPSAPPPAAKTPPASPNLNENAEKRRLMAKMLSGTASLDELQMLKAICMNDGDRACRNAAVNAINRMKKTPTGI